MAGGSKANLTLFVDLVSKLKGKIPGLKKDVNKVAAELGKAFAKSGKASDVGKAFVGMLDTDPNAPLGKQIASARKAIADFARGIKADPQAAEQLMKSMGLDPAKTTVRQAVRRLTNTVNNEFGARGAAQLQGLENRLFGDPKLTGKKAREIANQAKTLALDLEKAGLRGRVKTEQLAIGPQLAKYENRARDLANVDEKSLKDQVARNRKRVQDDKQTNSARDKEAKAEQQRQTNVVRAEQRAERARAETRRRTTRDLRKQGFSDAQIKEQIAALEKQGQAVVKAEKKTAAQRKRVRSTSLKDMQKLEKDHYTKRFGRDIGAEQAKANAKHIGNERLKAERRQAANRREVTRGLERIAAATAREEQIKQDEQTRREQDRRNAKDDKERAARVKASAQKRARDEAKAERDAFKQEYGKAPTKPLTRSQEEQRLAAGTNRELAKKLDLQKQNAEIDQQLAKESLKRQRASKKESDQALKSGQLLARTSKEKEAAANTAAKAEQRRADSRRKADKQRLESARNEAKLAKERQTRTTKVPLDTTAQKQAEQNAKAFDKETKSAKGAQKGIADKGKTAADTKGQVKAQKQAKSTGKGFSEEAKAAKGAGKAVSEKGKTAQAAARQTSSLTSATQGAGRGAAKMGKDVQKTTTQLKGMSKGVQGVRGDIISMSYQLSHVGFQLGMFGAAALAAVIQPVRGAASLSKEMDLIQGMLRATSMEMDGLNESAKQMSIVTIHSAEEVAKAMKAMAQAGFEASDILAGLPAILDFAASGELEMAKAVRYAVSTTNTFNKSLKEIPSVTNAIAAAAIKTNAEINDFGEGMKHAGPVAAGLNMTLEETLSIMGQLHQRGIRGSLAGTSIKRALSYLINPAGKVRRELEKLGITVEDSVTGQFVGLTNIIEQFQKNLGRYQTDVERTGVVWKIFQQRAGPGMTALINSDINELKKLELQIKNNNLSTDVAIARAEGLFGTLERLGNAWSNLGKQIGEAFDKDDNLKNFVGGLIEFLELIRITVKENEALQKGLQRFAILATITGLLLSMSSAVLLLGAGMVGFLAVSQFIFSGNFRIKLREIVAELLGWKKAQAGVNVEMAKTATSATSATGSMKRFGLATKSAALSVRSLVSALLVLPLAIDGIKNIIKLGQEIKGAFDDGANALAGIAFQRDKYKNYKDYLIKISDDYRRSSQKSLNEEKKNLAQREAYWTQHAIYVEQQISNAQIKGQFFRAAELRKELKRAQDQISSSISAQAEVESYLDTTALDNDVKKLEQLRYGLDLIFGKSEDHILGISSLLPQYISEIEQIGGAYLEAEQAAKGQSDVLRETVARERTLNAARISAVREYYTLAQDYITAYASKEQTDWNLILKARQTVAKQSLSVLERMYDSAIKKDLSFTKQIEEGEKEVLKLRRSQALEIAKLYSVPRDAVSSLAKPYQKGLVTALAQVKTTQGELGQLWEDYYAQRSANDFAAAKTTLGQIKNLQSGGIQNIKSVLVDAYQTIDRYERSNKFLGGSREMSYQVRYAKAIVSALSNTGPAKALEKARREMGGILGSGPEAAAKRLALSLGGAAQDYESGLREAQKEEERLAQTQIDNIEKQKTANEEFLTRVKGYIDSIDKTVQGWRDDEGVNPFRLAEVSLMNILDTLQNKIPTAVEEFTVPTESPALIGGEEREAVQQTVELSYVERSKLSGTLAGLLIKNEYKRGDKLPVDVVATLKTLVEGGAGDAVVQLLDGTLTNVNALFSLAPKDEATRQAIQTLTRQEAIEEIGKRVAVGLTFTDADAQEMFNLVGEDGIEVITTFKSQKLSAETEEVKEFVEGVLKDPVRNIAITTELRGESAGLALRKSLEEDAKVTAKQDGGYTGELEMEPKIASGDETGGFFKQVVDSIKAISKELTIDPDSAAFENWASLVQGAIWLFERLSNIVVAFGSSAWKAFTGLLNPVKAVVDGIVGIDKAFLTANPPEWMLQGPQWLDVIAQLLWSIVQSVYAFGKGVLDVNKSFDDWIASFAEMGLLGEIIANVLQFVKDIALLVPTVVGYFSSIAGYVVGLVEVHFPRLTQYLTNVIGNAIEGMVDRFRGWYNNVKGWISSLITMAGDLAKKILSIGKGGNDTVDLGVGGAKTGGLISPTGLIRGLAGGGALPGYGGGDRRIYALEDGEFVVNKRSVRGWGVELFHALNNAFTPRARATTTLPVKGMATGGSVGGGTTVDKNMTTIELKSERGSARLMGEREQVNALVELLDFEGLTTVQ